MNSVTDMRERLSTPKPEKPRKRCDENLPKGRVDIEVVLVREVRGDERSEMRFVEDNL
jgi:hypothetical protein